LHIRYRVRLQMTAPDPFRMFIYTSIALVLALAAMRFIG
jgi:hypothetical protein